MLKIIVATILSIAAVGCVFLLADNNKIEWASPENSVVVSRSIGGEVSLSVNEDLVYQDGVYVGLSQNAKFVIRVRMVEVVKDLAASQKAGTDRGFADPLKLQTDYKKLVYETTIMNGTDPTFVKIFTDERGSYLIVSTQPVPVKSPDDVKTPNFTL